MSLSHELELESQLELLERLQLLTNFGSNLITVGGAQGSGKSWLAQHYLESWAEDKNQSLLMCHPNQDDTQRRSTILNQIVSDPYYNPQDSLVDSLATILDGESCDVVIVIDDAHLLNESLISELWMLVLESQANPKWTVNVVLFAQSNSLESLLTRLSYGQEHKPIDLEIEPLNQEEADRFFEHLVMRYVEDDMERRARSAYRKVKLLPGEIMAIGEQKVEKRIIIRSIVGSPINIALIVVVLLLLLGGGYWWMMSQPSPDERAEQIASNLEQTVIPTLPELNSGEQDQMVDQNMENVDGTPDDMQNPSFDGAVDDSLSLPPDLVGDAASVGSAEDENQRVVITSDVVDAIMEGKADEADTKVIDDVVEQATVTTEVSDSSQINTTTSNEPESALAVEPIVEEAPETIIRFSFAREELKAYSPRSYTLQLAAMNTLEEVQRFIDEHNLDGQVYVYPTVRGDLDWYIVTFSNYPTIQVARDAVATLSQELQQLDPWAKSLSQVHREIDRTN